MAVLPLIMVVVLEVVYLVHTWMLFDVELAAVGVQMYVAVADFFV